MEKTRNAATHVLYFKASLPPVGYSTFEVKAAAAAPKRTVVTQPAVQVSSVKTYSNGFLEVTVDAAEGHITAVKNLQSNISTPFRIDWGWYNSSVGGCTNGTLGKGMNPCSGQVGALLALVSESDSGIPCGCLRLCVQTVHTWRVFCAAICSVPRNTARQSRPLTSGIWTLQPSGAYMFRPNSSTYFTCGPEAKPVLSVVEGPLVTEFRVTVSDWASHVVRLISGKPYLEVEWTAGPIPINQVRVSC